MNKGGIGVEQPCFAFSQNRGGGEEGGNWGLITNQVNILGMHALCLIKTKKEGGGSMNQCIKGSFLGDQN